MEKRAITAELELRGADANDLDQLFPTRLTPRVC